MSEWWTDIDRDILDCLGAGQALSPAEIARKVGLSEGAVSSAIAMLVGEGKARICLVASPEAGERGGTPGRSRSRAAMAS